MSPRLAIAADPADDAACAARACELATELGLPLDENNHADIALTVTPDRLEARVRRGDDTLTHAKPTWIDLTALDTATGPGRSLQNPLLKAIGLRKGEPRRPAVLDLTAGFGEDAWLLAAAGCAVTALEQNPAMFALLRDALQRAAAVNPETAARITLHHTNSIARLNQHTPEPETAGVLYLDPMFPAERKAAQRKPMRLAQLLTHDDDTDDAALLAAALKLGRRVVVKRPRKAPPLPGPPPLAQHAGRALRFDVYHPTPAG